MVAADRQKIARCPKCWIALWSNYAGSGPAVRVGTLDNPDAFPPDIHVFITSKQPWLQIPQGGRCNLPNTMTLNSTGRKKVSKEDARSFRKSRGGALHEPSCGLDRSGNCGAGGAPLLARRSPKPRARGNRSN
jgi:hypothetical protein